MHAIKHLAQANGYGGRLFAAVSTAVGDGGWAIEASDRWYRETYGDRLLADLSPGHIVLDLRDTPWRMRMPRCYGEVSFFADRNLENCGTTLARLSGGRPASGNVLTAIVDLTAPYAASLTDAEIKLVWEHFFPGLKATRCLEQLSGDELFDRARADYESSVENLMKRSWHNARWDTSQCAEKMFKGMLRQRGVSYPTGGKSGHDIPSLGTIVREATGAHMPVAALSLIHCPTGLRYGDEAATKTHAMKAHRALLGVICWLHGGFPKLWQHKDWPMR